MPLLALGSMPAVSLMSGRQEAVTGGQDTVTALTCASACVPEGTGPMVYQSVRELAAPPVPQKGRDRWSSQSVKRAPLFACDAARSDGPH